MRDKNVGLVIDEGLIFERSVEGRIGYSLPELDVPENNLDEIVSKELLRDELVKFPQVSEVDVIRHYTKLSQLNFAVDMNLYPLGSCTMKYNPKINEDVARISGFAGCHPFQGAALSQGALQVMYDLGKYLCNITGFDDITLQPAAGAHGEFTGMKMIHKCLEKRGDPRKYIIIPDSAHGTNPATASLCGYQIIQIKSDDRGCVDIDTLSKIMTNEVAAIMLTIPNTLGLFEDSILDITEIVHSRGGFVYMDGANLNALMGKVLPGSMGVDVLHINLHKTFSTPHGGGGPGAGPVAVKKEISPFLPVPVLKKENERYDFDFSRPDTIGKIHSYYGNFGILLRAYSYIRTMGYFGLKRVSETAVVNANYVQEALKKRFHLTYDRFCKHECVLSDKIQKAKGVTTMDMVKRLMDFGFHPPVVYFPLIVHGAIMIEPTETESKQTLDEFIKSWLQIADEAENNPDIILNAPHVTKHSRLDETSAARKPKLVWTAGK
ncbi:aminomethyl-transferring glycine dehydrogenase subunit GcvPB [bacterium]|nr:aminomethyl-transferring glycine dehydrogenase subunit GcvPB [bacterium]